MPDESLELTNYPSTGPIVSGPPLQPFVCQTDTFKLPDGSVIGKPQDANCSFPTRIDYVYLPAGGTEFKPMADTRAPSRRRGDHDDADRSEGAVCRAGRNRRDESRRLSERHPARSDEGSGADAVLAAARLEPPADRAARVRLPGRLVPVRRGHGRQPARTSTRLGEGYALFTNSLNHPTNSCNPFLAGETTMMGKEHFIETFGMPFFTVSMGGSGGAYTSLQVADAFPGLFDGVVITSTFPDALSIATAGLDAHLLTHYFAGPAGAALTDAQKVAVSGYSGMKAFVDAANQAQRTDPVPGPPGRAGLQVRGLARRGPGGAALPPDQQSQGRAPDRSSTRRGTSTASIRRPASRAARSTMSAFSTV